MMALPLIGYGIGYGWQVPREQPAQMRSQVVYDPNLTHPFFESTEWSYKDGTRAESGKRGHGRNLPLEHTARCFSTSFGSKHRVRFCEARLRDRNGIDLFIHESNPGYNDSLIVQIRNGMFTCQFWTRYIDSLRPPSHLIWTTKRQKLTLDKKTYQKGDLIKGRIDTEVLDELISPKYPNRPPRLIKFYGVFKTIVE
jgi:hypothetical protein